MDERLDDVSDGGADGPVVVTTAGNRIEAMMAVTALGDAGYPAVLLSDDAGGLHPEMSWMYGGAYRVAVPAEAAEAAQRYLAEIDAGEHALADDGEDATGAGADGASGGHGVGLDGHRRGWVWVAVFVVAMFAVFRLVDSATSFGWF